MAMKFRTRRRRFVRRRRRYRRVRQLKSELRVLRFESPNTSVSAGQQNSTLSFDSIRDTFIARLSKEDRFSEVQVLSISARVWQLDPDVYNTQNSNLTTFMRAYNPDAEGRVVKAQTDVPGTDTGGLMNLPTAIRGLWTPGKPIIASLKPKWKQVFTDNTVVKSAFSRKSLWWAISDLASIPNCCNGVHTQYVTNTQRTIKAYYTVRYRVRDVQNNLQYDS